MLDLLFFNVGHGDSIAVRFPDNTWGLVDCKRDIGVIEPNVLTFLKANKVDSLKFICITHPHKDHLTGLLQVMDYCSDIENIILYGLVGCDEEIEPKGIVHGVLLHFLNGLNKRSNDVIIARTGNIYTISSDIRCEFLNPSNNIAKDFILKKFYKKSKKEMKNMLSVIMKLSYKNRVILLCGDADSDCWNEIDGNQIKADIIKIAHHGSAKNNPNYIIDKIVKESGSTTIISSDGGKRYKSIPSIDVINYLKNDKNSNLLLTHKLTSICIDNSETEINTGSDLLDAGLESIGETEPSIRYDGAYRVTIDNSGKITTRDYQRISEISL